MKVIVDTRESAKFVTALKKICKNVTIKALTIGDIIIEHNDESIIIERKTIKDFQASYFKDGRGKEQCWRLKKCKQALYIIEGTLRSNNKKYSATRQAWVNIEIRDKLSIIRTTSMEDTAHTINRISNCLKKYGGKDVTSRVDSIAMSFRHDMKKSSRISSTDFYHAMVRQIPKCGKQVQLVITKKYPTLPELIDICKNKPEELSEIKYGKRNCRISKTCVDNIVKFLTTT